MAAYSQKVSEMIQKILIVDDVLPNVLLLEGYVKRLENVETVTFTNPAYHSCPIIGDHLTEQNI